MKALDYKQLESMKGSLEQYVAKQIDLSDLISNVEILLSGLDDVSESWREMFRSEWGKLEEVYSVAVVREERLESDSNRQLILPAIDRMRQLLDELPASNCTPENGL